MVVDVCVAVAHDVDAEAAGRAELGENAVEKVYSGDYFGLGRGAFVQAYMYGDDGFFGAATTRRTP